MTILDTNVLSEVLKPEPSGAVLGWLASADPSAIFTTAITQAEIFYGLEILPAGKRRSRLVAAVERIFDEEFDGRVLPFDEDAARAFGKIAAARAAAGRPISQLDAMIAAIARSQRAEVATRNASDFELCGVEVVNPWRG